ncbi:hypothetical protein [Methylobacterium sp. Leaf91]|uniref:hypothetical protein n=1 Tax=Methylobacterium sp. Leaf91 TaxID=1736247 RepID=UPI0006F36C3C|nr:hypothetical protein [Methylobacterium sp. Leaf91]KQO85879.1 hypothetical protein ASF32_09330 [Methylobacterium sp. Leaf91]
MRITLYPVPPETPAIGHAVGYVSGSPLSNLAGAAPPAGPLLSYDGRQALIDGQPVDHAEIAEALHAEIERVAKRVFGPDFVGPLSLASGLNVRSLARGRLISHGLPAPLLDMLGRAAATAHPRATGYMLQAVAYLWDEHVISHGMGETGPGPLSAQGREALGQRCEEILDRALGMVATMQGEAAAARARTAALKATIR